MSVEINERSNYAGRKDKAQNESKNICLEVNYLAVGVGNNHYCKTAVKNTESTHKTRAQRLKEISSLMGYVVCESFFELFYPTLCSWQNFSPMLTHIIV